MPVNPNMQLQNISTPLIIKHCPPFRQIVDPVGQKAILANVVAVVVVVIVVALVVDVSQKVPV